MMPNNRRLPDKPHRLELIFVTMPAGPAETCDRLCHHPFRSEHLLHLLLELLNDPFRSGRVGKQVNDITLGLMSGDAVDGIGKVQDQAAVLALNWKRQQFFKPKRGSDLMAYI
jgi:hypothetical protein